MLVVFGSINLDLAFQVPKLPAPGETVLGPVYGVAAGGKGANQAVAAARDGAAVAMVGRIGRDASLVSHPARPIPLTEVDLEGLPNRAPTSVRGFWPRLMGNALAADLGPILMFAPRRKAAEDFAQQLASQLPCPDPLALSPEQEMLAGRVPAGPL